MLLGNLQADLLYQLKCASGPLLSTELCFDPENPHERAGIVRSLRALAAHGLVTVAPAGRFHSSGAVVAELTTAGWQVDADAGTGADDDGVLSPFHGLDFTDAEMRTYVRLVDEFRLAC